MSSPRRNVAYTFHTSLVDTATGNFKAAPTIATGDFKVSTDGGAFANLATLPVVDPAGSIGVLISLSQAEMNGDKIMVQGIDAAGAEWDDLFVFIDADVANVDSVSADVAENQTDLNAIITTQANPAGFKKNAPIEDLSWPMRDAFGVLVTGETVTMQVQKDGGSFSNVAAAVAEIASTGIYQLTTSPAILAAEMNADQVVLKATSSGAVATVMQIYTEP